MEGEKEKDREKEREQPCQSTEVAAIDVMEKSLESETQEMLSIGPDCSVCARACMCVCVGVCESQTEHSGQC